MSSRESILSRVRGALAPIPTRAAYPTYADNAASTLPPSAYDPAARWPLFKERTARVNGVALEGAPALVEWLAAKNQFRGYCDPELWSFVGPAFDDRFQVERTYERSRVDDYLFGITRAAGAIAETGTVVLSDRSTSGRLAALTPWVHVAVFSAAQLHTDVAQAIAALGSDPNVIWCTGPSKTADVEGILIQGVHGPGVQVGLLLPELPPAR
jgi:L-lactate dehydrogenase complex protein LldG